MKSPRSRRSDSARAAVTTRTTDENATIGSSCQGAPKGSLALGVHHWRRSWRATRLARARGDGPRVAAARPPRGRCPPSSRSSFAARGVLRPRKRHASIASSASRAGIQTLVPSQTFRHCKSRISWEGSARSLGPEAVPGLARTPRRVLPGARQRGMRVAASSSSQAPRTGARDDRSKGIFKTIDKGPLSSTFSSILQLSLKFQIKDSVSSCGQCRVAASANSVRAPALGRRGP